MKRWLRPSRFKIYSTLLIFFGLLGSWLTVDLLQGHQRILADASQRAMQRSQIISQGFRTQVISTDYVLRDVLGRIQEKDLAFPDLDPDHAQRMRRLLKEKSETIPGFFMIVFNRDCVFTATANGKNIGARSKQELCETRRLHRGPGPLVNYVSGAKSASGGAVLALSRHLLSPAGDFLGGVLGVIELEKAQEWFDSLRVATGDSVALLDDAQVVLARQPRWAEAIEKPLAIHGKSATLPMPDSGSVAAIRLDLDGRERLFGFSKIEGFPFVVVYGIDKAKALGEWYRRAVELSTGYFILLVLAFLAARSYGKTLKLNCELQLALSEVHTLQGLIPICSYCKKIREDGGAWSQLEMYISSRSKAKFSHGVCPDCKVHMLEDLGGGRQPKH